MSSSAASTFMGRQTTFRLFPEFVPGKGFCFSWFWRRPSVIVRFVCFAQFPFAFFCLVTVRPKVAQSKQVGLVTFKPPFSWGRFRRVESRNLSIKTWRAHHPFSPEQKATVMKDVTKKIALTLGAPIVVIYLIASETYISAKKTLRPARVHPINISQHPRTAAPRRR